MREYLFRGKTEKPKQWVYGSLLIKADGSHFIAWFADGVARFTKVIKETVGQYVGLDSDGNKMFEGDVVQYIYTNSLPHKYIIENFDGGVYPFDDELQPEDMRVIGNIHDNPELIQEVFNS